VGVNLEIKARTYQRLSFHQTTLSCSQYRKKNSPIFNQLPLNTPGLIAHFRRATTLIVPAIPTNIITKSLVRSSS
jgi:hypothetical protein